VAVDRLACAHQRDVDGVAELDAGQLRLFEIAFDVERAAVDDGHHGMRGRGVRAFAQVEVRHDAVHARHDVRAFEVQLRHVAVDDRLRQRGSRLVGAGLALFARFLRDEIVELRVALVFALCLRQRRLGRRHLRFRLTQREFEAGAVDLEQRFARLHLLVVVHVDLRHLARHVGRHLHDVRFHAAVARPRFDFVVVPQLPARVGRARGHHRRETYPADRRQNSFHSHLKTSCVCNTSARRAR